MEKLITYKNNHIYTIIDKNYRNNTNYELDNECRNIRYIQKLYLQYAKIGEIVLDQVTVNITHDYWDLSKSIKPGRKKHNYKFNFNGDYSDEQKTILKLYSMFMITQKGIDCASNKYYLSYAKKLIDYMNKTNILFFEDVEIADIETVLCKRNKLYSSYIKDRRAIEYFILFYSRCINDIFSNEFRNYFKKIDRRKIKAETQIGKTPLLPNTFYKLLCDQLYEDAIDESLDKMWRGRSALTYIDTQIGTRVSELVILRIGDLKITKYKGKLLAKIKYRSSKSVRSKSKTFEYADTRANERIVKLWNMCIKLFADERTKGNSDYLVPNKFYPNTHIQSQNMLKFLKQFCAKYYVKLNLLSDENKESFATKTTVKKLLERSIYLPDSLDINTVIYLPTFIQFRVYLETELCERDVDWRIRAEILNHHDPEMPNYYARPVIDDRENALFAKDILKEIIQGEKLLGNKANDYTEKIKKIIKDNNYNVARDLDEIIDKASEELPIKRKSNGWCMQSNPGRICLYDEGTDKLLCAVGICPNQCHMYFNLPQTVYEISELYKSYKHNEIIGHTNYAKHELLKMNAKIESAFIPEYKEVISLLERKSKKEIIKLHPNMKNCIENLSKIKEDIEKWKTESEKILKR